MERKTGNKRLLEKCGKSFVLVAFMLGVVVPAEVRAAPTKELIATPYECGDSSANVVTTCLSKEDI